MRSLQNRQNLAQGASNHSRCARPSRSSLPASVQAESEFRATARSLMSLASTVCLPVHKSLGNSVRLQRESITDNANLYETPPVVKTTNAWPRRVVVVGENLHNCVAGDAPDPRRDRARRILQNERPVHPDHQNPPCSTRRCRSSANRRCTTPTHVAGFRAPRMMRREDSAGTESARIAS